MADSQCKRPIEAGDDSDSDVSHGKSNKKNKATTDSTSGKKRSKSWEIVKPEDFNFQRNELF